MTDENQQPPQQTEQQPPAQSPQSTVDIAALKGRVDDLASEVAALQHLEQVVHQMASQLVQRGFFHNTKTVVTEWYQALLGKHSA